MALSEFEHKQIEQAVSGFLSRRRPPPHLRAQLDLSYRIDGQSLELLELRPRRDEPAQMLDIPIAKATHVKRTGTWKVYWMRADMKWHRYDPAPEVESVEEFLAVVEADECCCFFG